MNAHDTIHRLVREINDTSTLSATLTHSDPPRIWIEYVDNDRIIEVSLDFVAAYRKSLA